MARIFEISKNFFARGVRVRNFQKKPEKLIVRVPEVVFLDSAPPN
jgi:hypothetical protein